MDAPDLSADVVGRDVFDAAGERMGRIDSLYRDSGDHSIYFAAVTMLRRGRRRLVFVSLVEATVDPTSVTLRCSAQLARRAPQTRPGQRLPAALEGDLYRHYEMMHRPLANGTRRLQLVS